MATINKDTIHHLARLSRLSLTEDEAEKFAHDLDTIIRYADDLKKVETEGIVPMIGAVEIKNSMRADEAIMDDTTFEPSFPDTHHGRLKVPKIL